MSGIELRVCKTWDECLHCEELQYRVWEMPDYRDIVPAHLLITAIKNGGLLIGAFDGVEMIGFAFGFLGSEGAANSRHLKHTSHMLAVLSDARARGLGAALKWKQRDEVLRQGLDLMTWTYDPLQAGNAYLNLARLGAIARRYIRDAYGAMTDALNVGLASDRFEVEWLLPSRRVSDRSQGKSEPTLAKPEPVYRLEWISERYPRIVNESALVADTVMVEIPPSILDLKDYSRELATDWRERTRGTLKRAFELEYVARDFVRFQDEKGRSRGRYVLTRRNDDIFI